MNGAGDDVYDMACLTDDATMKFLDLQAEERSDIKNRVVSLVEKFSEEMIEPRDRSEVVIWQCPMPDVQ